MLQNLSSVAVVIDALRVKDALTKDEEQLPQRTRINSSAAKRDLMSSVVCHLLVI